jgi:WXG100 family type VII secretion target
MANLNVTYEDMREEANRLTAGQQEIDAKLDQMKSRIDSLVSGGYVTDKSSVAFAHSYQEFNDGARKTIAGLEGMATYLKRAADALEEADNALAKALGK